MAYVTVPKDLAKVKSEVMFGLTKRQLVCFVAAELIGAPLFFLLKGAVSSSAATLCMIVVMLPFFMLAMYKRHGQPLEVIAGQIIQAMFLRPKERPYQTDNFYAAVERQIHVEKEVRKVVQKSKVAAAAQNSGKPKHKLTAAEKREIRKIIQTAQGDAFDGIREFYTQMLRGQLEQGNNGLVKTKFLVLTIEAKDIKTARARFSRIVQDTLGHFKVIGSLAKALDGREWLEMLRGILHPDGDRFSFDWSWLAPSGLSVKDFIAPSSFRFGESRRFEIGGKYGAVSFLQVTARSSTTAFWPTF